MTFTKEEQEYLDSVQKMIDNAQAKGQSAESQQRQTDLYMQEQNKDMITEQIDVDSVLEMIENLLRGRILKEVSPGIRNWVEPTDNEMIVLTEYGVYLIMNTICFYLNKNTLLSNYKEEIIMQKMEDFSTDLADTVFMEYEKIFKYPTFEDCKKILLARIERKKDVRAFAYELMGKTPDKNKIEREFLEEIEGRIEQEITKIKEQVIKNKLKRFLILVRTVQDVVHSTYLRALFGQERKTLREHIHVSESRGQPNLPQRSPSKVNPLNWFGGGYR